MSFTKLLPGESRVCKYKHHDLNLSYWWNHCPTCPTLQRELVSLDKSHVNFSLISIEKNGLNMPAITFRLG
jgi:glutaredoxin-related protein